MSATLIKTSPIPRESNRYKIIAVDGKVYTIGGRYYVNETHYATPVYIYDPKTDIWDSGAACPYDQSACGCAVVGKKIYCIGGWNVAGNVILDTLSIYDTETNRWSQGRVMPGKRCYVGCTAIGDKVYAFGGIDENSTRHSTTYIYDTLNNTWTQGVSMKHHQQDTVAVVSNDKIYCFGRTTVYDTSVQFFDLADQTWNVIYDSYRTDVGIGLINNKIYCIGGNVDTSGNHDFVTLDTVDTYDTFSDQWTQGADLPEPYACKTTTHYGNQIFGYTNNKGLSIYTVDEKQENITSNFQDTLGDELQPSVHDFAEVGSAYITTAPGIPGYTCIAHRIDGGELQLGDTATIPEVSEAGHTITFIYKRNEGGPTPGDCCACPCKTCVHIGEIHVDSIEHLHIHGCGGCGEDQACPPSQV